MFGREVVDRQQLLLYVGDLLDGRGELHSIELGEDGSRPQPVRHSHPFRLSDGGKGENQARPDATCVAGASTSGPTSRSIGTDAHRPGADAWWNAGVVAPGSTGDRKSVV